ncbi:hypothetical protein DPMN_017316 [Dreissena polymorpha]|uniref:Uncharacterized protein n=1 Tax=Dreissena polymorpha TaxID=45954 RepID=A0A9D4NH86_DREPO|nr:hypothetical protein DPMN_017316 [Dreissena polymorpha]
MPKRGALCNDSWKSARKILPRFLTSVKRSPICPRIPMACQLPSSKVLQKTP